jgi:hypothetical protein
MEAFRDKRKGIQNDLMDGGPRGHPMIVVKNDRPGGAQPAVKVLKISQGKCWQPLMVFRSEERERLLPFTPHPFFGLA